MRKVRKLYLAMGMALVAMLVGAGAVFAVVTFDPASGEGFVGKGDVQLIYGWNNQQLQANAGSVQFRAITVSEQSWECTNDNNQKIQERERSVTEQGLVDKIARERNQITGFNLSGYSGSPTVISTDGPRVNSCPDGPWSLTQPAGDPEVISSKLQVSIDGTNWFDLS